MDDTQFYESTIRGRYGIDPAGQIVCEIGIGYGRLSANFKTARHVYGIDVSQELFQTTAKYLESKGFSHDRFTLLLNDEYKSRISSTGDFVFSSIVFQHIPKTFQVDYLRFFAGWLKPGGQMLIQFLVAEMPDAPMADQPSFFWKVPELYQVASDVPLILAHFDVELVVPGEQPCYWAWVHWTC
jgi:cyclopropane fatty-acyl-phospholipid synthase-like methyltransferase